MLIKIIFTLAGFALVALAGISFLEAWFLPDGTFIDQQVTFIFAPIVFLAGAFIVFVGLSAIIRKW